MDNRRVQKTIYIPLWMLETLEGQAKEKATSTNDLIISILYAELQPFSEPEETPTKTETQNEEEEEE